MSLLIVCAVGIIADFVSALGLRTDEMLHTVANKAHLSGSNKGNEVKLVDGVMYGRIGSVAGVILFLFCFLYTTLGCLEGIAIDLISALRIIIYKTLGGKICGSTRSGVTDHPELELTVCRLLCKAIILNVALNVCKNLICRIGEALCLA